VKWTPALYSGEMVDSEIDLVLLRTELILKVDMRNMGIYIQKLPADIVP
jgi:hypothetical protein